MSEWKPIETAPTDMHQEFLVWVPFKKLGRGYITLVGGSENGSFEVRGGYDGGYIDDATHWMPLPEPPK